VVHYQNVQTGPNSASTNRYPWPIIRLADLYLLYAEAINEVEGPNGANSTELFHYLDEVRKKAGLEGVKYSWDNYALSKKYTSQSGMREIIRRERLIELSLEGQRFWDLRRWKTATNEYGKVESWSLTENAPEDFYKKRLFFKQTFFQRDYFSPIANNIIENNPNIVQNTGW
jgi:hypothetical protein